MKEIMIATSNAHKVEEFREMLEPLGIQVRSLLDLEEKVEIEETGTTFAENAMIKALSVHERLGIPVISDDSGLEVDAMNKAPGVYSARFLGYDTPYEEKNQYIMDQVKGKTRTARYVCAIAYVEEDGAGHVFTGVVEGEIADHARGEKGFGYDPIFYVPEFGCTTAEMTPEQKNKLSHRGKALRAIKILLEEKLNEEEA
mgnify:CR=1 FL=1